MENSKLNKTFSIHNILVFVSYQAFAGIIYGFGVYMLLERGFSSSLAGIVLGISNILTLLFQPIIANFLDHSKKFSIFDFSFIFALLIFISYFVYLFVDNGNILIILVFGLTSTAFTLIEPLTNSISNVLKTKNIHVEFGTARACGSFAYGIICIIFGYLTNRFSYISVIIGGIIFSSILTIFCYLIDIKYRKLNVETIDIEEEKQVSFKDFIVNNKKYVFLCLALVGVFYGYMADDNFVYLIVENVGGNSADMGIVLGIKAILEGVSMINFPRISKKVKLETLLTIAVVGFSLKAFCYYVATSTLLVYICQIMNMLTYALILPGIVEYINRYMSKEVAVRGNSLFTMSISSGIIISSFAAGVIADRFGVSMMCLISLITSIVSTILFVYILYKKDLK